ncbi:MAG TPA: SCO family protein [Candidatus Eisenbacteria bacterium]|nr:SCO family protein [Candidatus Eisenbacteria bacterium]
MTRACIAALALAVATAAAALDPSDYAYTYGVGTFVPEYAPPPPGSYELPPIKTVSDHPVLADDGAATTLFALAGNRVAIVAFVYTTCVEAAGCPVSTAALHRIDRAVADDPELRGKVALVSVSFDPERDTPARMAATRRLHEAGADWYFVTTQDDAALQPLLDDFGQPVGKLRRADGSWTGLFRHVLKIFLVDGEHRVRNVYSVGFLHPDLILNDVRTVLREPVAKR